MKEGAEVLDEITFEAAKVVVEQDKKLLLHQVDLGQREEASVLLPVHVLRRAVVEVFGGADEDGEEHAVTSALHA